MNLFLAWIILLVNLSYLKTSNSSQPPNIVIIYADDLGWNDVSFHGSPQIPTPNIDALALNGITLQNYYGEWLCSPSRASLLTGKYPIRLGLQHFVLLGGEASGLPLNETTMPQHFKKFGYETHMIGKIYTASVYLNRTNNIKQGRMPREKVSLSHSSDMRVKAIYCPQQNWHLGYQTKEYTPTYRGFDSFFGYWNGLIDYYDHTYLETHCTSLKQLLFGLDLHDDMRHVQNSQGKYATHLFTVKAEEVIMNHDTSKQNHGMEIIGSTNQALLINARIDVHSDLSSLMVYTPTRDEGCQNLDDPLFLYFAHLAVHAGNDYQKSQAPGDVVSQFKYISDLDRRIHAGVIKVMDDSVGTVFNALYQKNMLENTIFMFISDNGGVVDPKKEGSGNNNPLRGSKFTYWEGGIHLPAVIWSPLLNLDKPRISNQLMHVSDWLPTLYTLIGGNVDDLGPIDGINMWQALINDAPSPRTGMLQNLDPISVTAAYRQGNLKLTSGATTYSTWGTRNFGLENLNSSTTYEWVFKNGSIVRDVLQELNMWIVENPDDVYQNLLVTCEQPPPKEAFLCDPSITPCLFNITADPCEYYDIADQYPDTVDEMFEIIQKYEMEQMKPQSKDCDASANPMCHHFLYVPWLDPDHYQECDFLS